MQAFNHMPPIITDEIHTVRPLYFYLLSNLASPCHGAINNYFISKAINTSACIFPLSVDTPEIFLPH